MKFLHQSVVLALACLLVACSSAQPAVPLPTLANVNPQGSPAGTVISTAIPTATSTLPPTATSTFTPTATPTLIPPTATATAVPSATPTLPAFLLTNDTPPLPAGKGGLIIVNHIGAELSLDLSGKVYKIPANGRMIIFLSPGRYTFSGSAPGFAGKSGSTDIADGFYLRQDWG